MFSFSLDRKVVWAKEGLINSLNTALYVMESKICVPMNKTFGVQEKTVKNNLSIKYMHGIAQRMQNLIKKSGLVNLVY